MSAYIQLVLAHLREHQRYPASARRLQQEGVAWIAFTVARDGDVVEGQVRTGSGVDTLDAEAFATLWRAEPLPPIPHGLPAQVILTVPVEFELTAMDQPSR